ncbi:membrane-bound PQQ-dependent dehydrogenase, glucose/quinate/shikimate family [Rhizorhapis sp. SPR117]|uniref:membrane-bound PQQ-dependent dehydrogenase, glucose/quinate/shikimate family n=1 Tax=Rhizorhapis sp. SPR117 TaxID=2912611 RepID=UPI001EFF9D91|nr:membrane-bound PQQ-dependent dehydrogenase, glucose/quinate/shikimate family [Rhizorhapis sp. SPR117]
MVSRDGVIGRRVYAVLLALIASALLYGGGTLATLGGSPYYLLAGLGLGCSAVLIWRGNSEGVWIYAAIVVASVTWAIWEVGFSGWQLMPRISAWLIVGAWMLTPWFRRSLKPASFQRLPMGFGTFAIALVAGVALGSVLHPLQSRPADPKFQAGITSFPSGRGVDQVATAGDWPNWGNGPGGSRFSPLTQITPENVGKLKVLWRTSISNDPHDDAAGIEATPIMVGDSLYTCNNNNQIFAIDAETGKVRWHNDPVKKIGRVCRGVAYYRVSGMTGMCAERIISATGMATLIALDARTGQACADFGNEGKVDLLQGLTEAPLGYYYGTSAPTVVRGKIVVGGWVTDGQYWGEPSGVVRAFDAVSGQLAWAWDMGRPDRTGAPAEGETYTPATPNSWAPMSADEDLGLVYVPTGNATPDYYGAQRRPFDDEYSSSVVAIDAQSGKPRWSFQTTHHDLWDYDVASQPTLFDLNTPEGKVPALLQLTKRGEVFLLNRVTGQPIWEVTEHPAPQAGTAPGERLSPTQPFSDRLPSFRGPDLRETDMWGITPLDQIYCRIKFRRARYEGPLTPPGLTPSITSPGYMGGMNWGSASVDLDQGVMIVNTSRLPNHTRLLTRDEANERGLKPIASDQDGNHVGGAVAQAGTPFAADTGFFMSPLGVPCQAPPFGFLSAVDLVTGKLIWSHPLGTANDSGPLGIGSRLPITLGTPTSGGSITTRSGLVFIGAALDRKFRAFDVKTGRELWEVSVERGVFATPMTYLSPRSQKQILVVADGGPRAMRQAGGAELIAYGLPD